MILEVRFLSSALIVQDRDVKSVINGYKPSTPDPSSLSERVFSRMNYQLVDKIAWQN